MKEAVDDIVAAFSANAEIIDGNDITVSMVPDLLTGMTLFNDQRLVIIKNVSNNMTVWEILPEWVERTSDETHIVFVEPKPDKRTKTFKAIQQRATVRDFPLWGDRDGNFVESWVVAQAAKKGLTMDKKSAQFLVRRVGLDQWRLDGALEKLALLGDASEKTIEPIVEATPLENVFLLLDAALRKDTAVVMRMVKNIEQNQDPYMTFGLLSSQVFQLAALIVSKKTVSEVAVDIGAHPFALQKLLTHSKKISRKSAHEIIELFAEADRSMKSTATDPWIVIEKTLIKTASL